jgi:hypothetical protein
MNLKTRLAVLLLSTLTLLTSAYAQITPSADAFTNTADPTTNYGANVLLDVNGATEIAYIQFNLASIPSSATVSQATLKLYVNAVTKAGTFNVDYVNAQSGDAQGKVILSHEELSLLLGGIDLAKTKHKRWYRKLSPDGHAAA